MRSTQARSDTGIVEEDEPGYGTVDGIIGLAHLPGRRPVPAGFVGLPVDEQARRTSCRLRPGAGFEEIALALERIGRKTDPPALLAGEQPLAVERPPHAHSRPEGREQEAVVGHLLLRMAHGRDDGLAGLDGGLSLGERGQGLAGSHLQEDAAGLLRQGRQALGEPDRAAQVHRPSIRGSMASSSVIQVPVRLDTQRIDGGESLIDSR